MSEQVEVGEFFACTERKINPRNGWMTIECRYGLWSVEGKDHNAVFSEALAYFRQYKEDGEYSSIIGGPSVNDVLMGIR